MSPCSFSLLFRAPSLLTLLLLPSLALAQSSAVSPSTDLERDRAVVTEAASTLAPFIAWLEGEIGTLGVPGVALGIVSGQETLAVHTWGVRTVGESSPVDSHTLFRIASVSKTFAGAVTAMMVHDRQQSWDTPIISILPQYAIGTEPSTQQMTLRHVVSHTTGLMPHAYSNMLDSGVAYNKIQEKFREIPTVCPPGRCYGYQNVIFSLVSDVVEVSAHETYAQYVQERLFTPLGMTRASVGLEGYEQAENVSSAHQMRGDIWRVVPTNAAYYTVGPAAGVNASVEDMMRWAQANLGAFPQVLPPEVLAEQQTPVVETPRGSYFNRWPRLEKAWYGLGWRLFDYAGVRVVHHGGGVRGFRTELVLVPSLDIAMVVLFNGETPLANDVVPAFLDAILP